MFTIIVSFEAFGLFDPSAQDEDSDEDLFLSATELLEKKKKGNKKATGKMPRSNTDQHLKKTLSSSTIIIYEMGVEDMDMLCRR